jgi:hypothetical protein
MLNEGIIVNDSKTLVKSVMIRQLLHLGPTTPDVWERSVFRALTGYKREDMDSKFEDNQAGYFTWIKSFDQLIEELIDDGYVRVEPGKDSSRRTLSPVRDEDPIDYSQTIYPEE